jgi:type IV pilus assembly protein PilZ
MVKEQRRYARTPMSSPLHFVVKGETDEREGVGKDISIGGIFVETTTPATFGATIIIRLSLPGSDDTLRLPGLVRWTSKGGMRVQFGLLGALETHVITEFVRKHNEV